MKIKPAQADAFARDPAPGVRAVLVYGPDRGLVRERVDALIASVVDDPKDPFRVAELAAGRLAREPALVADEAAAIAFGGGRRVVWVREAGEEAAKALAGFLAAPAGDALVVAEAGELDARSKLRQAFEKADNAAALACYRDDSRSLPGLIRDTLAASGLDVSSEAVAYLTTQLGGDRLVTRSELAKLAAYKGDGRVELADARACVGDTAALSLEDVALACGDGDIAALERAYEAALQAGANPVQPLRAAARHFQRLHQVAGADDVDQAMAGLRPPVFWKTKAQFRAQAQAWRVPALAWALERLLEAEGRVKSTGMPAATVGGRALMEVAARSPLRRRRRR